MLWNKGAKDPTGIELTAFTDEGVEIEGKCTFSGTVLLNGRFGGEIVSSDTIIVGEKGVVNANVQTVDAIIMGQYEGNMIATGDVEITETGRVSGNIKTDSLVISKGGFFNGNVTKMNEGAPHQVLPIEEKLGAQQFAVATRAERDERILRG